MTCGNALSFIIDEFIGSYDKTIPRPYRKSPECGAIIRQKDSDTTKKSPGLVCDPVTFSV